MTGYTHLRTRLGIFSRVKAAKELTEFVAPNYGTRSPWSDGQLQKLVWSDVFGTEAQTVTRGEAMSIPAVAKARGIIFSLIADKPLRAYRGDSLVTPQPAWLQRTDGEISPWHRMAYTLDDLMFYGWSLWAVERGAAGQVTNAARVPYDRWEFDTERRILVDSQTVDERSVILFAGPSDGLLDTASRTLRGAAAIDRAWIGRARSPIPAIELHQTNESNLLAEEAEALVSEWERKRNDENGAVAFTPYDVEVRVHGNTSADLYIEGRNATRLDVANFFNLPAALLDGSTATASLTYSTTEGKRNELYDYTVPYWAGVIEARLSQDDVVPAGQRVRFDFATLIDNPQSPTGAVVED